MAYTVDHAKEVGRRLVVLLDAFRDGVDIGDMDEALALLSALQNASDEIAADKDATLLYILSGAAEAFGNDRLDLPQ